MIAYPSCRLLLAGVLLAVPISAEEPPVGEAILCGDAPFTATLTEITDQGVVVLQDGQQTRQVAQRDFVSWGKYSDRNDGTHVLLADGSVIVGDVLSIDSDAVAVVGRLWRESRLPRAVVRAILFHVPADVLLRDKLYFRALEPGKPESRLLLTNGDELAGTLPESVSREPGAFQLTRIVWNVQDPGVPPVEVPLDRVAAVLLPVELASRRTDAGNVTIVGLRDGSLIRARSMRRTEQGLEFQTTDGAALTTDEPTGPAARPWEAVVMLQALQPQVTYVSDMAKFDYKHVPYLDESWPYRLDRGLLGGRLRFRGSVWVKGVAMHSRSRLAVETGGVYDEFQAELAIDQSAGRQGSVVYRVYVQESGGSWKEAYESGIVRGGEPWVPVRVKLTGAPRLALIVDFADRGDQGDHALWLNARLVRHP